MEFKNQIKALEKNLDELLQDVTTLQDINNSIKLFCSAINDDLPILIFGNGGSASDALHITGELVGRFLKERNPVNIICLNSNVSIITAWANDYDYNTVFERQVRAHSKKGGICWGISTSGNSSNVLKAFKVAQELEMKTIGLTGKDGGKMRDLSDILIRAPSNSTPRIQELHLPIYHYICEQIEKTLF
jgi:D-sedoheptulose 7-phosphate isomerase